jgi:hypothetical protein
MHSKGNGIAIKDGPVQESALFTESEFIEIFDESTSLSWPGRGGSFYLVR